VKILISARLHLRLIPEETTATFSGWRAGAEGTSGRGCMATSTDSHPFAQIVGEIIKGLSTNHSEERLRESFRELFSNKLRGNESDGAIDETVEAYANLACDFLLAEIPSFLYSAIGLLAAYASVLPQRSSTDSPVSKEATKEKALKMFNVWIDRLPLKWPARHRPRKTTSSKQKEKEKFQLAVIEAMVTCLKYGKKPTDQLIVNELNRWEPQEKKIEVSGLRTRLRRYGLKKADLLEEAKKRVKNSARSS
jgi:hypothetical protein